MHRYLAEFDFRYNRRTGFGVDDTERAESCLKASKASALPIGGLVKPVTLKQKARRMITLVSALGNSRVLGFDVRDC